ncbi:Outer membrane protein (OmpH-like) [Novipirellula aureliae]|uniref:Outer membrane protein (OmpH-like) n=1 Tax=Novipirellula aureliae TaxID=2527966 RepID=A0A5C6DR83_9BACT|nr:OmpH family outer membrane protein [Novipirellula aureliae]TWU38725.1 Outer membrane protein (OmpH-like) [Novipirellula aureliae]
MLTNSIASTASIRFEQSSNQSSEVLRWFGKAAIAFATLAGFVLAPAPVSAQQAASTHPPGHRVALIDVTYILKNLPAIKAQISKLEADLEKHKAELKQKRDTLKQSVEQLKTLKVGTADYARQEEYVANLESALRSYTIYKHRELSDAEAKTYYDSYQRMTAVVRAIATRNNINLVLRFNSEDIDSEQNDSVTRGIMRNVVYHDSTVNMTNTVLQYLKEQTNRSQFATIVNPSSDTNR